MKAFFLKVPIFKLVKSPGNYNQYFNNFLLVSIVNLKSAYQCGAVLWCNLSQVRGQESL